MRMSSASALLICIVLGAFHALAAAVSLSLAVIERHC